FGQGNAAKVPWIAFLGNQQEVQDGVYPALLYYKAAGVLILAKGLSETNAPSRTWRTGATDNTIDAYFAEARGVRAERYGSSMLFREYKVPLEVSDNELNADLDGLIHEYEPLLGKAIATQPLQSPAAPEPAASLA